MPKEEPSLRNQPALNSLLVADSFQLSRFLKSMRCHGKGTLLALQNNGKYSQLNLKLGLGQKMYGEVLSVALYQLSIRTKQFYLREPRNAIGSRLAATRKDATTLGLSHRE
jgi:hypothetical protein